MLNNLTFVCAFFLFLGTTWAQSGTVSSGGATTGAGGETTYSIGLLSYITATGNDFSMTEGLQQPYELYWTTDIEAPQLALTTTAYPNPTTDLLRLRIEEAPMHDLSFQLCDVNGKVLQQERIAEPETTLNLEALPAGMYFVSILFENQSIRTLKIIKNQ